MPYTIHKLPLERIAILTIDHALDSREEGMRMGRDIGSALAECGDHMHLILDYTTLDMSIGVIIMSLAASLLEDGDKLVKLTDPRLTIRVVGSSMIAKLWASAMRQKQYGGKGALLFDAVDEAVIDARKDEAERHPETEFVKELVEA